MEKQILVPTNFSKHAWNALVFGLKLYKSISCNFILLNVYDDGRGISDRIPGIKPEEDIDAKKTSKEGLDRIMQGLSFRKENQNHEFETLSLEGDLEEVVQEIVNTRSIDLILLGTEGANVNIHSSYKSKLSKLADVLQNCAMLFIPEDFELTDQSVNEIVFPSTLRFPFQEKELDPLKDLASNSASPIRVLYIDSDGKGLSEEQERLKENLEEHFSAIKNTFHRLTKTTASTGIHLFIESRQSTMLALYKRKQGFFSKLFLQSKGDGIEFDPSVPVLLLKELD
ncbi:MULTISPECIES: universal stress protein [Zunongwangia]|mgnify:FL=1|jgi:nucleotide-binding universal stress UspA family protein|uniref:Universal stress protein family protein n=2 Tax=Zunongwangia profunda TaxID=398743 RepID=D5B9Z9_ZUNPS|nr:universal stress protein [Zunongwangia profunda]MAC65767.1 universal stress protein [Flavobacteriaceae bacterium]MAS71053.1 universal stress protein [Zunongwangia sp.]ADF52297.1 universal stress protein family protein [Zunongwangia profunda SM-A87]MAG87888.1 universal stress protein [Flavobacteriaceae bacterium]MCC4229272.1 universal stress protein [Zunongwangia profunda]|tara:strand:+ start:4994 stop:5845 length:852 start_codon:yes stop_codon:yes gene_type:complete